jgi:ribosomal protein S12 methylthiotransferase
MKISEGCDRPCSFCAIPIMRGKHRSRPIEDLVREASLRAANGTKELLLIAQDSTFYGLDLYRKRNLSELLLRLSDVPGIEWIRLHYAFPTGFPEDILHVMAERENICRYLDIPLQHGSSRMLRLMRRGINRERTEELIAKIRELVPGIAIRTTMIAGHPGETADDFQELCNFVTNMRFDRLGIFTYSHEEQTHAFTMEDDVPEEEKQERANIVMAIQEDISLALNQEKIGKTYPVLIDRMESGQYVGRTEFDSPEVDNEVLIDAKDHYLRIGDFTSIRIQEATAFDLFGVPDS